jgi:hypothetical protein
MHTASVDPNGVLAVLDRNGLLLVADSVLPSVVSLLGAGPHLNPVAFSQRNRIRRNRQARYRLVRWSGATSSRGATCHAPIGSPA